jgi:hypothetical protein
MDVDGKYHIVHEPFTFDSESINKKITVPKGFVTDFASVPRAAWSIVPPTGRYTQAAVVHDWLYWDQPSDILRDQADMAFLEGMRDAGVNEAQAQAIYRVVRSPAGESAWQDNARLKAAGAIRRLPPGFHVSPYESWEQIEGRLKRAQERQNNNRRPA